MKVFVYGTLQRGSGNHRLLADARFLGEAVTVSLFGMTDVGFPFVHADEAIAPVAGELFDVDEHCMRQLDRLEGEGSMYDRVTQDVMCGGKRHRAFMYVRHAACQPRGREVIVNADNLLVWPRRRS